jgi:4-hydroxy-tetrahydrodipicolinate reductase
MIRVCVAGITGRIGRPLAAAVASASDLELVAGVSRSAAGTEIHGVPVHAFVSDALDAAGADVLVDYTDPSIVRSNVLTAIERRVSVVVGANGLTDAEYAVIDARARETGIGVIAGENFSLLAALLLRFAQDAARHVQAWEIGRAGARHPPDVPAELAERLRTVHEPTEVEFGRPGERLVLRYHALESAAPYVGGTLVAIRAAPDRVGLTRGLDRLLFG